MPWVMIAITVASALVSIGISYYRNRESAEDPEHRRLQSADVPVVTENDPIPVIFGSPVIRNPNVVWWRQLPPEIDNAYSTPDIVGLSMLCGICQGPVESVILLIDDKRATGPDSDGAGVIDLTGGIVDHQGFQFGTGIGIGPDPANGVYFPDFPAILDYWFLPGDDDQDMPSDIPDLMVGVDELPSFRGLFTAFFQIEFKESLLPIAFIPTRVNVRSFGDPQWNDSTSEPSTRELNPIHCIREILTDQQWGKGVDESRIDETSFISAATTIFNESFGISLAWDVSEPYQNVIGEILRHIDAELYEEPTTGKYTIKLIRDDYDVAELPVADDSVIESLSKKRPMENDLVNEVVVTYSTRDYRRERTVNAKNTAAQQFRGVIADTITYPFVYNRNIAARLASRDLLALSSPLATLSMDLAPSFAKDLRLGDVFIAHSPQRGVNNMVVRVTSVQEPDENVEMFSMRVEAIEDKFAFAQAISSPPGEVELIDPIRPEPINLYAMELPLRLMEYPILINNPTADLTLLHNFELGRVGAIATTEPGANVSWDYTQEVEDVDFFPVSERLQFAPRVELDLSGVDPVNFEAGTVSVDWLDKVVPTDKPLLAYFPDVSDEFGGFPQLCAVRNFSLTDEGDHFSGTCTLNVGMMDTTTAVEYPDKIFGGVVAIYPTFGVLTGFPSSENIERFWLSWRRHVGYFDGVTVENQGLPRAHQLIAGSEQAESVDVEVDRRSFRPYAPGLLRISEGGGNTTLSWRRRSRLESFSRPQNSIASSPIAPQEDIDGYVIRVYETTAALNSFTLLVQDFEGAGAINYVLSNAAEEAARVALGFGEGLAPALLFTIVGVRDSIESKYPNTRVLIRE